ncbi:hypothetical protein [Pseudomonas syringae]|uniref:Uncharacterized protein n=1 Tax=Pseudomonas syringae pv. syringae TaxID=321 RepID=A0AAE5VSB3_PSESY|nr:hypothetical protein [Pseudomonas syringae]PBP57530.1 hypothetical protein CCL10_05075 [Pseudomonas syringae]POQ01444.1 hypothetical protein CXB42_23060 [Pseudomonas syringae pv. syringae]UOF20140.1 hypothetical protein N023_00965 [Pseudomonas syringae CC440]UZA77685.1 hypothetical protein EZZ79_01035 [Pseudomonas syringae]
MSTAENALTILSWSDILKIVLASGVVASLIGWFKDWLLKSRDRARDSKSSAIGVIAKLDLYAIQSRMNIRDYQDQAASLDPHVHYQNWPTCTYPDLEISRDELEYLAPEHSSTLAWLTTEKALASQHLYAIHDVSFDPTEVHAHKAEVVGYFGYEAYLLALKLREKFNLPPCGQRWGISEDFLDLHSAWVQTKQEVKRRTCLQPTEC